MTEKKEEKNPRKVEDKTETESYTAEDKQQDTRASKKAAIPSRPQRHLVSPHRRPRRRITLISSPQQEVKSHYDHYSVTCSPPRPRQVSGGALQVKSSPAALN